MLKPPASRLQFVVVRDIDADVARVFDVLTSEAGMQAWIPMCRSVDWRHAAGAKTPGVGSVRHIVLAGGGVAAERIVAWERGRELHYRFDRTTLPIQQLTRDYVGVTRVDPIGAGRTRLSWSIHFDSPGVLAAASPIVRMSLRPLIASMASRLARTAPSWKRRARS